MLTKTAFLAALAGLAAAAAAQTGAQTLEVGDEAPALSIEKFVHGQETPRLEQGTPYVITFWATSSEPSVSALERLDRVQQKHAEAGLRVIAVGASEEGDSTEQRLHTLSSFVENLGDVSYAVAFDDDESMLADWMRPAGRNAVPTTFVINREGKIAFIGNPLSQQDEFNAAVQRAAAPSGSGQESESADDQQDSAEDRPYALMTGDTAPPLAIGEWVKGEPVEQFEPGQVYIVEFWATWCGPCIAGMPHVSELQQKHGDDVIVIGVNAFEDPAAVEPFMQDRGDKPSGDELMQYRVGIEEKDDPARPRNGVMAKEWMQASGRRGIPSAFIVDQQGRIAWQGHPTLDGEMDRALEQILAGEWDLEAEKERAIEEARKQKKIIDLQQQYATAMQQQDTDAALSALDKLIEIDINYALRKYAVLLQTGRTHEAYDHARQVMPHFRDNPMALSQIAWSIVSPSSKPENQDLALALETAQRAVELTNREDAGSLNTLAHVHWDRGEKEKAVEVQTRAVERAAGTRFQAQFQQSLDRFKEDLGRN